MEHSHTTSDLKCRCGQPAVARVKIETRSNVYSGITQLVDYHWEPVCEYHKVKSQILELEIKEL